MPDAVSITQLLNDWNRGERGALDEVTRTVYQELRNIARSYLNRNGNETLQPTELIGEAYLRLMGQPGPERWESRTHFFGIAARLMRLVLVDHARTRGAAKRGRGVGSITLPETAAVGPNQQAPDVLDLNEALDRLARVDPRKAELVEMRYFGGLSREEMCRISSLNLAAVKRELRLGEAWLRRDLTRSFRRGYADEPGT